MTTRERRIDFVCRMLWKQQGWRLRMFRLQYQDLTQQAWVEYLKCEREWPTFPGRYLYGRLIDWIRHETHYNHRTHTMGPSIEHYEDSRAIEQVYPGSTRVEMDVESGEIVQKVKGLCHDARAALIVGCYQEGYSMKAIGKKLGITEGRVCQLYQGVIRQARASFTAACVCLVWGVLPVWAQTPGLDLTQNDVSIKAIYLEPTTEMDEVTPLTDLAFTTIYLKENDVVFETVNVPAIEPTGGKRIEQDIGVVVERGKTRTIEAVVTATDTSPRANESDPVTALLIIDRIPPGKVKKAP